MLAKPGVQRGLFFIKKLLMHLQMAGPIQPVTRHIIAQAPAMLRHAAENSKCEATDGTTFATHPASQLGYIGLIAGFAGGAGACITIFVARRFSGKPSESAYFQM